MSETRLKDLTKTKRGKLYAKVTLREDWIKYTQQNHLKIQMTEEEKQNIFKWAKETRISKHHLEQMWQKHPNTTK